MHQQYIADIEASAREALATVDPIPFYMAAGENVWAGVKANLDTVTERAAAPIVAKYTGVLAAADIEELHLHHDVPDHAVAAPRHRARRQQTGPPLTRMPQGRRRGPGALPRGRRVPASRQEISVAD